MTDRFSNFADLAEHYAREIANPDYAAAFMEQTELAKLSIEHEPSAAEMPDPDVAQATIEMMLATTGQNKGADVIAAAWASSKNVPVILCMPDASRGPSAPYQRNARMLSFKPVETVVCSGGGIQANLADRLREARVPMRIVREAGVQNEAPPARSYEALLSHQKRVVEHEQNLQG